MGDIDKKRKDIPVYRSERKLIQAAIGKTYKQIMDYLIETLYGADENVNRAEIERELRRYVTQLQKDVGEHTSKNVRKAYQDGRRQQILGLLAGMDPEELKEFVEEQADNAGLNNNAVQSGLRTSRTVLVYNKFLEEIEDWNISDENVLEELVTAVLGSTEKVAEKQIQALALDTYQDLLEATEHTLPNIKKVVRETVRDIIQANALNAEGYETQARQIEKRLTKKGLSNRIRKNGFVGIVDKSGRRWNVGTYADMVTRTKLSQAYRNGVEIEGKQRGFDLAVISDHGAKDACSKWEGMVVSLTGKVAGFPTLKEAKGTNEVFHPNCQHSLHLIRDVSELSARDRRKFERQLENIGNYKERQKKR